MRKTLLQRSNQDFDAIILQVRTGTGNIHELKLENQAIVSTTGADYIDNPATQEMEADKKSDVKQIIQPVIADSNVDKNPEIKVSNVDAPPQVDQIPLPPFLEKEFFFSGKKCTRKTILYRKCSKKNRFFPKQTIPNGSYQKR